MLKQSMKSVLNRVTGVFSIAITPLIFVIQLIADLTIQRDFSTNSEIVKNVFNRFKRVVVNDFWPMVVTGVDSDDSDYPMKTGIFIVTIGVIVLAFTPTAEAQTQQQAHKECKELGNVAAEIQMMRQRGTPQQVLDKASEDRPVINNIINRAYESKQYENKYMQRKQAKTFAREIYEGCMIGKDAKSQGDW